MATSAKSSNDDINWGNTLLLSAIDGGFALGKGLYDNYRGKKIRSQQGKLSYELANYEAALDYQYSKLYNDQNYALAQRYAQNSAKWAVNGLRRAGLNPLLAAGQGFNANFGQAGVSSSPSVDTPSLASDPTSSADFSVAQAAQTASQLRLNSATAKNLQAETDLIKANTAKAQADAAKSALDLQQKQELFPEELEGQRIKNRNEDWTYGNKGLPGVLSAGVRQGSNYLSESAVNHWQDARRAIDGFLQGINAISKDDVKRGAAKLLKSLQPLHDNPMPSDHSAKQYREDRRISAQHPETYDKHGQLRGRPRRPSRSFFSR